jgi:serine/threonine-protein kinase RsbW
MVAIIQGSPTVRIELDSRPESVALVRAMLTGAVELLEFDTLLLNDLNMAVSEACNNVVMHAYNGTTGPLIVDLRVTAEGVEVSIRDRGDGFRQATSSEERLGAGIAVITALADRAEFFDAPGGGTEVRVTFSRRLEGERPLLRALEGEGPDPLPSKAPDEVVVTLSPMALLPGILGRMTRLLAARARFSLERFSDTYLLIDHLVAHVESHAVHTGISFGLCARESQIDLKIGPLLADPTGPSVIESARDKRPGRLHGLVDELALKPIDHSQMLCMVVRDHPPV